MKQVYLTLFAILLICFQPVSALSASRKPKKQMGDYAIDMGLSVKWASFNLGENGFVSSPKEEEALLAWGEIETKSDYKWNNYKWYIYKDHKITKYNSKDRKGRLEKEDDVASVKLGSNWRIPTASEFKELINNCEITPTKQKGVRGFLFTSKINGNSIFIPIIKHDYDSFRGVDNYVGYYWCDDLKSDLKASVFRVSFTRTSENYDLTDKDRCEGLAIRPVFDNGTFFDDVCSNIVDEVFRRFCLNSYDRNKDGRLSVEEALQVGKIDVRWKNIQSLEGIEYFENLVSLACDGNKLTQLDVSKNTVLEKLSCNDNQLSQLDVSKNTKLKELGCYGNKLTQLDVSKNTKLEELGCSSNQLASLDVSKNTALRLLFCERNQLTSLNVSGCSALTRLSCFNNQLTSLDVRRNTALEELSCNDNQLTSLDISRNTALWSLICYNNKIANLDVSRNTKLSYLKDKREEETYNRRESTKETEAVWVSDTGNIIFTLYTDKTANAYVLGVDCRCTWAEKSGGLYIYSNAQTFVIKEYGDLYTLDNSGRLTRVKKSSSSPLGILTGSDGVIMYKR